MFNVARQITMLVTIEYIHRISNNEHILIYVTEARPSRPNGVVGVYIRTENYVQKEFERCWGGANGVGPCSSRLLVQLVYCCFAARLFFSLTPTRSGQNGGGW